MSRWQRYWFADGGRLGAAILRIAIALAVWLSLHEIERTWPATAPGGPEAAAVYRPVGVWMLVGDAPPGAALIESLWFVARISTVVMLVGLFSRAATAVSFVSSLALASLYYSGTAAWSHELNVVFLAQLAFLGARGGDTLSLDALVRTARGLAPRDVTRGYQWSIRLVQLAVALMFASAVFHKVMHGYPTLSWALSDNLRHQLLVRFDLTGLQRTAIANWLIDDAWKFRTAALLNLVVQMLPLVGCFLVRRPVLRAACGAFFVVEIIALGLAMGLWNLHWLPLAAVFVDWDALFQACHGRDIKPTSSTTARHPPRHITVFIIAFVTYDLITAFSSRIDQRWNTYPFSGFPMFSSIRARKPYDRHLPYSLAGGQFEIMSSQPVPPHVQQRIDHAYRKTFAIRNREELRKRLAIALADVRTWVPAALGLRFYYTVFEVPAYPARAVLVRRPIAVIGELYVDGRFRSLLGTARISNGQVALTAGEDVGTQIEIEHYLDDRGEATHVESGGPPWSYRRPPGRKIAFVAVVRDGDREQRWLVATAPR